MSLQSILISGGYDKSVRFWNPENGQQKKKINHEDSQVNALEITSDKKYVAAAGHVYVYFYDLTGHTLSPVLRQEVTTNCNVTSIAFGNSPSSRFMITTSEDGYVRRWTTSPGHQQKGKPMGFKCKGSTANCAVVSCSDNKVYACDNLGYIYEWDMVADKHIVLDQIADTNVTSLDINADGMLLAFTTTKGSVGIYQLHRLLNLDSTYSPKKYYTENKSAHDKYVLRCRFSPDSTLLATASGDGTSKLWRTADLNLYYKLDAAGPRKWVWDCRFSDHKSVIFTASSDGVIKLWDVDDPAVLMTFEGHKLPVTALAFYDESSL